MKGLLIRVGADLSPGGGRWNSPADAETGEFAYVPIPEGRNRWSDLEKPYELVSGAVEHFGRVLPRHLSSAHMHLDPDFDYLTYGDQGQRAAQIQSKLGPGDLIVFYAGLANLHPPPKLIYAIIGLYVIDEIVPAHEVPKSRWHENAHTRRPLKEGATDIVVRARPGVSGRLKRCLPIGNFRDRAYRVFPELLKEWGGLSIQDGYLQRSARLPEFGDAEKFYRWFRKQRPRLVAANNPTARKPRYYVYKLTVDCGAAPCVHVGVLSVAICKPMIRSSAQVGDFLVGFAANSLHKDNRLIYVAKVTKKLTDGVYFRDSEYRNRPDCSFEWNGRAYQVRPGAKHHASKGHLPHDLGKPPDYPRANVLLSDEFRYFSDSLPEHYKKRFPALGKAIDDLAIGHRVNHRGAVLDDLKRLVEETFRKYPKAPARGSQSGRRSVCRG